MEDVINNGTTLMDRERQQATEDQWRDWAREVRAETMAEGIVGNSANMAIIDLDPAGEGEDRTIISTIGEDGKVTAYGAVASHLVENGLAQVDENGMVQVKPDLTLEQIVDASVAPGTIIASKDAHAVKVDLVKETSYFAPLGIMVNMKTGEKTMTDAGKEVILKAVTEAVREGGDLTAAINSVIRVFTSDPRHTMHDYGEGDVEGISQPPRLDKDTTKTHPVFIQYDIYGKAYIEPYSLTVIAKELASVATEETDRTGFAMAIKSMIEGYLPEILKQVDGALVVQDNTDQPDDVKAPAFDYDEVIKAAADAARAAFAEELKVLQRSIPGAITNAVELRWNREMPAILEASRERTAQDVDALRDMAREVAEDALKRAVSTELHNMGHAIKNLRERLGELEMKMGEELTERYHVEPQAEGEVMRYLNDDPARVHSDPAAALGGASVVNSILAQLGDIDRKLTTLIEKRGMAGDFAILHEKLDTAIAPVERTAERTAGMAHLLHEMARAMDNMQNILLNVGQHVGAIRVQPQEEPGSIGGDAT